MRAVVAAVVVGLAGQAWSHDMWADGRPVEKWAKESCCGPSDVHELQPNQIHDTDEGYKIDGYPYIVPHDKALPSQDGHAYLFYRVYSDGSFSQPYCFYIPMSF